MISVGKLLPNSGVPQSTAPNRFKSLAETNPVCILGLECFTQRLLLFSGCFVLGGL